MWPSIKLAGLSFWPWLLLPVDHIGCLSVEAPLSPFPNYAETPWQTTVDSRTYQANSVEHSLVESPSFAYVAPRANQPSFEMAGFSLFTNQEATADPADEAEQREDRLADEFDTGTVLESSSRRPSRAALTFLFAVVLLVGLLAVRRQAQREVGPKLPPGAEQPAPVLDEAAAAKAKILERIEATQKLLPAAEKLAAAVDTEAADKLLEEFQEILSVRGSAEEQESSALQAALDSALGALERLHELTREEANKVVRDDLPDISRVHTLLLLWQNMSLSDSHWEALAPFSATVSNSYTHYERLSRILEEVHTGLKEEKPFADESDGAVLVAAAVDFNYLMYLRGERKRIAGMAVEQSESAQAALKAVLYRQCFHAIRRLHGTLELAEAYVAITREAVEAEAAAEGEEQSQQQDLDGIQLLLQKSRAELGTLAQEATSMAAQETIAGMLSQVSKLGESQQMLSEAVSSCCNMVLKYARMPALLDEAKRSRVRRVLEQALHRIAADEQGAKGLMDCTFGKMTATFGIVDSPLQAGDEAFAYLNDSLARELTQSLLMIRTWATERVNDIERMLKDLEKAEKTAEAVAMMKSAVEAASSSAVEQTRARTLLLQSGLVQTLEQDMRTTVTDTMTLCERIDLLDPQEAQQMRQLETQLHATQEAASSARTLEDRALAAGKLRELALTISRIAHAYERRHVPEKLWTFAADSRDEERRATPGRTQSNA
ncbi:hypothetical protein Efla_001850 [Eimeria flavescens]